jgi:hypothetical protein
MDKNYIITSVSLTPREKELINEFNLSPTAIIKSKVAEIEFFQLEIQKRRKAVEIIQGKLTHMGNFIESKGLWEEWNKYEGEK